MDKTSSITRRYSAFTLVEVLLVVVILSILATLVVLQIRLCGFPDSGKFYQNEPISNPVPIGTLQTAPQ